MPLGAPGALQAMLHRSFGAESFHRFWHYWNPIWGFYLSRNVMRPLHKVLALWIAVILTFLVSGALHDLAVTLVKWRPTFFITPWFTLMGVMVVLSKVGNLSYKRYPWFVRMLLNVGFISITFAALNAANLAGAASRKKRLGSNNQYDSVRLLWCPINKQIKC